MKINELFDKAVPYKITDADDDEVFAAEFTIDKNKYEVVASNYGDDWDFEFGLDGEIAASGTGNEFQVFATVKTIMIEFINKIKPKKFTFSASENEPSRVRLYKRMAQQIATKFGYDLAEDADGEEDIGEHDFIFTKK